MLIIGCDPQPSFQQIAFVDTATGKCGERKLTHMVSLEPMRVPRRFHPHPYAASVQKPRASIAVSELNFELWIGDPAEIRAKRVRKQKTDRQDAEHLMRLL